jgi:hypothetical protein
MAPMTARPLDIDRMRFPPLLLNELLVWMQAAAAPYHI